MARVYPKGKDPKMVAKFAEGGRVPSSRDVDPTKRDLEDSEQDVENYMRTAGNDSSNYKKRGEKKFWDGGTEIPGRQAAENDAYRKRMGWKD
jgi:hypothetical protein